MYQIKSRTHLIKGDEGFKKMDVAEDALGRLPEVLHLPPGPGVGDPVWLDALYHTDGLHDEAYAGRRSLEHAHYRDVLHTMSNRCMRLSTSFSNKQ